MYNPLFRPVRKAFKQNAMGIEELDQTWADIDIYKDKPGTVPAVCAISRLDPVVPYPFAARNLNAWRDAGAPVKVLPNWAFRHEGRLLHSAAIGYFDSNIREIIEISEGIKQ